MQRMAWDAQQQQQQKQQQQVADAIELPKE